MDTTSTYIIIPVFNEDPLVLRSVLCSYKAIPIIVVDDGSAIPVQSSLSDYKHEAYFEILKHKSNFGQGAALQSGVKRALELGGTVFCSVDGDGQHHPDSCFKMLDAFKNEDCDILLGSRFLNNKAQMPILKRMVLKGGILVNYLYAGLWLHDAHCGLRVFNREFATKLQFFNKRQAHASEVLWIIKHFGFRFKEYPADVIYTEYAMKKGQSVWNSFLILKDLIRHKIYLLQHPINK